MRRLHRLAAILAQDLRFALRTLAARPAFALLAVVVLGVGIGLATAIFGVVHAVLQRPLPVRDQDRIVVLNASTRDKRLPHVPMSLETVRQFAERSKTLETVAWYDYHGTYSQLARYGTDAVWNVAQSFVSGRYFDALGVHAIVGRTLRPEDDVAGAPRVTVLSYGAWRSRFAGDPSVLGRRITTHRDNQSYTIVGVMPEEFDIPHGADCWVALGPLYSEPGSDTLFASLDVIGRLRPGADSRAAREELEATLRSSRGANILPLTAVVQPLLEVVVGNVRQPLLIFSCAAALLLLMTCTNVANLLLVRGLGRSPEIALRSALGAGMGRITALLLTESTLLALAGSALGIVMAMIEVRAVVAFAPPDLPRVTDIRVDTATVVAAIAIGMSSVMLFGLPPAIASRRRGVWQLLRSGTHQIAGSRRLRLAAEGLVVAQVALAVLVLSAAALLTRTLRNLERVDFGIDQTHLLAAERSLPPAVSDSAKRYVPLLERITERVSSLPGIVAASPIIMMPLSGHGVDGILGADGETPEQAKAHKFQSLEIASPSYFKTLGIPILAGRAIDASDRENTTKVAVISEGVARELWPSAPPAGAIGKRLRDFDGAWSTVVGIVGDTRLRELQRKRPAAYFPLRQNFLEIPPSFLAIRTAGDPAGAAAMIRRAVAEVDPSVAVATAATFDEMLARPLAAPRFNAFLLGVFAFSAVTLAAVGLYGVLAALVRQRTRELAVRRALGASDANLRYSVLGRGLSLAAIGGVIGVAGAMITNRVLAATLFEVGAVDTIALGGSMLLLMATCVVACALPARMATRIDPVGALRSIQ